MSLSFPTSEQSAKFSVSTNVVRRNFPRCEHARWRTLPDSEWPPINADERR